MIKINANIMGYSGTYGFSHDLKSGELISHGNEHKFPISIELGTKEELKMFAWFVSTRHHIDEKIIVDGKEVYVRELF